MGAIFASNNKNIRFRKGWNPLPPVFATTEVTNTSKTTVPMSSSAVYNPHPTKHGITSQRLPLPNPQFSTQQSIPNISGFGNVIQPGAVPFQNQIPPYQHHMIPPLPMPPGTATHPQQSAYNPHYGNYSSYAGPAISQYTSCDSMYGCGICGNQNNIFPPIDHRATGQNTCCSDGAHIQLHTKLHNQTRYEPRPFHPITDAFQAGRALSDQAALTDDRNPFNSYIDYVMHERSRHDERSRPQQRRQRIQSPLQAHWQIPVLSTSLDS